jgi:hypothetical protein
MALASLDLTIFQALAARLDEYVAASPIAVAYPNLPFTPVSTLPWLRPWPLPALATAALYRPTGNQYAGIWQVDVFWPVGQGLPQALAQAGALCGWYARGSKFMRGGITVRIEDPPYAGPAMQEPDWLHVPVTIRYKVFT